VSLIAEWSLSTPLCQTLQSLTLSEPFIDTEIESRVRGVGGLWN
jgi:hypothetical protein